MMTDKMTDPTANRGLLGDAANMLLRVLIASYFIAVALHLIPGTDLSVLFTPVLPAPVDTALASGLVFLLAYMVMLGLYTRPAALVLALMTIFSSFLAMVANGGGTDLANFWRDVALIAALILTYRDGHMRRAHPVRVVRRHIEPRRLTPKVPADIPRPAPYAAPDTADRAAPAPEIAPARPPRPGHTLAAKLAAARRDIARQDDIDNIFVDPAPRT